MCLHQTIWRLRHGYIGHLRFKTWEQNESRVDMFDWVCYITRKSRQTRTSLNQGLLFFHVLSPSSGAPWSPWAPGDRIDPSYRHASSDNFGFACSVVHFPKPCSFA